MKRLMLLTLLALALPTAVLANSTDPLSINFTVVPIGGRSSFAGATLGSSTAFTLGASFFLVNRISPGDESGLTEGSTNVTLSSTVSYGPGDSGQLLTPFDNSWVSSRGSFSEVYTRFTATRSSDGIKVDLFGTLTGPNHVTQPIVAILSANQAGGDTRAINWAFSEEASGVTPIPEPGTLGLLELGLLGNGMFGLVGIAKRKLKLGM